jgi:hypothetical protein
MIDDSISQAEKHSVLHNDARVREQQQASTFHQHALSQANDEAGGRFAAVNAVTVVGSEPAMKYPAAAAYTLGPDAGIEPPTGYRIDEMPPLESSAMPPVVEEGAPVSEAPSSAVQAPPLPADDVETSAGAPFSEQITNE